MPKPIALHYGAGNIGRGFIGLLLSKTHHVVFADIQKDTIDAINTKRGYFVTVISADKREKHFVQDIEAVLTDSPDTVRAYLKADIITTSVGPDALKFLAPSIANGLRARANANKRALNVIACENLLHGSNRLKKMVEDQLKDDPATLNYLDKFVGFPNCAVDRIAPPFEKEALLDVAVEEFYEWFVDRKVLKDPVPNIQGMKIVDNLDAYVERKLFTLNTAHAFLAYIGHLKGHKTLDQSMNDPQLRLMVEEALKESGAALVKKHDLDPEHHQQYVDEVLNRFETPQLDDILVRVGRSPLRKLRKDDRLVGPVNMARDYGLPRDHLILAIAAALLFDHPEDRESVQIQEMIKEKGLDWTVREITGLEESCEDFQMVIREYRELAEMRKFEQKSAINGVSKTVQL